MIIDVIFSIILEDDIKTFNESMSSIDAPLWKKTINDEMDSIEGKVTWKLVDLPDEDKPIRSKWIFKIKCHLDGSIITYKDRLVTEGCMDDEGINYFNTYALVARINYIKTIIKISALKGLYIHQTDVKKAFLYGYLNEDIYLEKPEGFVILRFKISL